VNIDLHHPEVRDRSTEFNIFDAHRPEACFTSSKNLFHTSSIKMGMYLLIQYVWCVKQAVD
jgi:hypothetical protein